MKNRAAIYPKTYATVTNIVYTGYCYVNYIMKDFSREAWVDNEKKKFPSRYIFKKMTITALTDSGAILEIDALGYQGKKGLDKVRIHSRIKVYERPQDTRKLVYKLTGD